MNKSKQKRPRSRTLTQVHDNMLDDLCFPAEIVGKRIRHRLDGSRLVKVHLDKNQQTNVEHKVTPPHMFIIPRFIFMFAGNGCVISL